MGSGSSRPTIPAYPAAKARYPTRDFKEIVSGYDRISENSVLTMNKFESYFPKDGKQYSHLLFIALKCGRFFTLFIFLELVFIFIHFRK